MNILLLHTIQLLQMKLDFSALCKMMCVSRIFVIIETHLHHSKLKIDIQCNKAEKMIIILPVSSFYSENCNSNNISVCSKHLRITYICSNPSRPYSMPWMHFIWYYSGLGIMECFLFFLGRHIGSNIYCTYDIKRAQMRYNIWYSCWNHVFLMIKYFYLFY